MIGQREHVLQNKASEGSATNHAGKARNPALNQAKFFNLKQIIKLNVDEGARYNKLQREAMTPEDQKPQFTIEQAPHSN